MKLTSLMLFGAGYVLGSKAGRERYEQILELVAKAAEGVEQKSARDRILEYADGGQPLMPSVPASFIVSNGSASSAVRQPAR